MTIPTSTFSDSARYKPTDLALGAILPKKTYLSGRVVLLWPLTEGHAQHLRFTISAKYQANAGASEYVAETNGSEDRWRFMVYLAPSTSTISANSGQTVNDAIMAKHKRLEGCLGAEIKILAEDLKITKINGKAIELEGAGPRTLWTEKIGTWTIFQEPTQSSVTPSWLESDKSLSSPAGPTTQVPGHAGPSNYRPITSHLPSLLNLRPTNDPVKRKLTTSPEKSSRDTIPAQREPPAKRTSTVVKDAGSFGPRTFDLPEKIGSSSTSGVEAQVGQARDTAVRDSPRRPSAPVHSVTNTEIRAGPASEISFPPNRPSSVKLLDQQPGPIPAGITKPEKARDISPTSISMPPDRGRAAREAALMDTGRTSAQPMNARQEAEAKARGASRKILEEKKAEESRKRQEGLVLHRGLRTPDVEYGALKTLRSGATANVMGVVAETTAPKEPSGRLRDHIMSLVISDPTSYQDGGATSEDLVVTIFRGTARELPTDIQPGTPILFRNIKLNSFNDKVKGNAYSAGSSTWAYLVDHNIRHADVQLMRPPITKPEVDRLMDLRDWWQTAVLAGTSDTTPMQRQESNQSNASPSGGGRKTMLLGEAKHFQFLNPTFKIIHIEHGRSVHFELYVADGSVASQPLRNFHGVRCPGISDNAIFCLSIERQPEQDQLPMFEVGNYLFLRNVRAKMYKGELEMIWSERVLPDQQSKGWEDGKPRLISPDDARAIAIEQRLAQMQNGKQDGNTSDRSTKEDEMYNQYIRSGDRIPAAQGEEALSTGLPAQSIGTGQGISAPIAGFAVAPAPPPCAQLATHLFTTFNDPVDHPESTIADILSNRTFPNKYRVKARVIAVHTRGVPGNTTFVQKHCHHCRRSIKKHFCQSCQDENMTNASWRYRFIAILQEKETGPKLPILISDAEAEKFLPSLPPVSSSQNPNDLKKTKRQVEDTTKKVMGVLQGGEMNGIRPVPYIDWTLQATIVKAPKGYVGARGETGVVVYKAFGMGTR